MTSRVSTLLDVGREGHYVFLLLEWYQFADAVREELNRQADGFGQAMGRRGSFVMTFPQSSGLIAEEVTEKPWPEEIRARFGRELDPIILVFDRGWDTFDPTEHPYAIIWLSDFRQEPSLVLPALKELVLRTKRGDDVIKYLHGVARRQAAAGGAGRLAGLASYVEVKPSIFGVQIDVKAILKDLGAALA